jgi:hypothetical protein
VERTTLITLATAISSLEAWKRTFCTEGLFDRFPGHTSRAKLPERTDGAARATADLSANTDDPNIMLEQVLFGPGYAVLRVVVSRAWGDGLQAQLQNRSFLQVFVTRCLMAWSVCGERLVTHQQCLGQTPCSPAGCATAAIIALALPY